MDLYFNYFERWIKETVGKRNGRALPFVLAVALALLCACPSATPPPVPDPFLPSASSIPAGIYSGTLDIAATVRVDGDLSTEMESLPFSIVIDQDGRFLDAAGVPFMINQTYYLDIGTIEFTNFCRSISVDDDQILVRFDVTAALDIGSDSASVSGYQTDSLHYDGTNETIVFVRSQVYGGVSTNGDNLNFVNEANASLRPN